VFVKDLQSGVQSNTILPLTQEYRILYGADELGLCCFTYAQDDGVQAILKFASCEKTNLGSITASYMKESTMVICDAVYIPASKKKK
jgi:hypothetical protein